jgi:hypothetical protein
VSSPQSTHPLDGFSQCDDDEPVSAPASPELPVPTGVMIVRVDPFETMETVVKLPADEAPLPEELTAPDELPPPDEAPGCSSSVCPPQAEPSATRRSAPRR